MKILLVVNPKSGKRLGKRSFFDRIFEILDGRHQVERYFLRDYSGEIFDKYQRGDFDVVVAVGGDGTVNTCVNLILKYLKKASLLIIPAGSTNASIFGLGGSDSQKSSLKKLKTIDRLDKIVTDVGYLKDLDRYFLQSLVIGYLATISELTDQPLKNKYGFWGYCLKILKNNKPVIRNFRLEVDGQVFDIEVGTLGIHNVFRNLGKIPTRQIVKCQDGKLDAIFYAYDNFFKFFVSVLYFIFLKGNTKRKLKHFVGRSFNLELTSGLPAEWNIDGEKLPKMSIGDNICCECLASRLTILV